MRKDSQTSSVWNFYEKVDGGGRCSKCNKVIACFGNTSNLVKHLRRVHKMVLKSIDLQQRRRKRRVSPDSEDSENEAGAPSEEEPTDTVSEANSAVHTIQAYRDVNGTTFLYLHPAPEGEAQVQNTQFQPVVAGSEAITANGEIVSVAVHKDSSILEDQAVDGDPKTQEVASSKSLVHVPVKNIQGSSLASRTVVRQMARPSPIKSASSAYNICNGSKEDTYDAFGKYVASLLRGLQSKSACKLQGEIVNWILKEQMKTNDS